LYCREEKFRAKRAIISNEQINAATNPSEQNTGMTLGPASFPDEQLLKIPFEEALQSADRLSPEDFVTQAQRMEFHVSSRIFQALSE
jgi:hypothetical protein